MEFLTFIGSFLGGGTLGALINWLRSDRADRKKRRIDFLNDQIRKLYGPVYFFTFQNKKLFELNKRFMDAIDNKIVVDTTIEIANDFIKPVLENNNKIYEIFNDNYSYIDPEDIDSFAIFYENHIRLNIEKDENGRIRTPMPVLHKVGNISFMRPEFIKNIETKFTKKKQELENLLKN